jgi:hypothetical protein
MCFTAIGGSYRAVAFGARWFVETPAASPTTWIASINSTGLGELLEGEIAMRRVEEQVESNINLVLHDWGLYQAAKGRR